MKKFSTLFLAICLLTLCHGQKKKLELNLSKGETYNQNMISNVSIVQTINGQQNNMGMAIDAKMTYKVIDVQNSIYDIEVRYETLSMKMNLPNGVMEFSSEKNDDNDIFSTILGVMKNKPFLAKMTKTGKVNEVRNIESVFSNMFDKFPHLTEIQKQQIKDQLMQSYGEKAFKGNLEMVSAIFTDSPVEKGDKWNITTQLESGMAAKMETIYELKELSDSYYLIQGVSKIATADKDAYVESNGMPLKYDMTGTMTSDIKISKESGWILDAKIHQTIKGTAYIKDNPQMPGGLAIPMTMTNEMIITEK
jgi:hypothetical protein